MRMLTWGNTGKKIWKICKGDIRGSEHRSTVKKLPNAVKLQYWAETQCRTESTSPYVKFGAKNNSEFVNEHFN